MWAQRGRRKPELISAEAERLRPTPPLHPQQLSGCPRSLGSGRCSAKGLCSQLQEAALLLISARGCGSEQGRSNLETAPACGQRGSNKDSLLESQTLSPIKLTGVQKGRGERIPKVGELTDRTRPVGEQIHTALPREGATGNRTEKLGDACTLLTQHCHFKDGARFFLDKDIH